MEFHEKLQELRKEKGLTQEALAQELFVSRTAISKWESGRGYPSIDSLKLLSRYFSISIDALIGTEEILSAAEEEKRTLTGRYAALLCGGMDVLSGLMLILPIFGNGGHTPEAVSLLGLTGVQRWVRLIFFAALGMLALNGICAALCFRLDKPVWQKRVLLWGMALSAVSVFIFIATRQPYAGLLSFSLFLLKIGATIHEF
ncbi:MAG: helix-turn-helix domain-containing protein [bacterium]